ncbi:HNH endonuclease [Nostoc sp. FACHB-892]|uniref:HNH endonuclease family protein n=1 Tax=Nostoc sp. FACHB-892 TaxID=2692843 RepID=UPI0016835628|nr:HNH endonuclease family protein [Nostoc sp. FACHB-892]MBD2731556.1 HNH endonuclease [Nostoc sp. FACHB-892]
MYSEVQKVNPSDVVDGLQQVLKGYDKSKVWPDDDALRDGIITKGVYTTSLSDRAKLLLESLESSLTKEKVKSESLTVEHIMPQTLNKEWKTMLGVNHASVQKKWLHTLGNLTLTGYNSEMGNKPFSQKLAYFNTSNLSLNHYFRPINIWNEEAIKKRAEDLADIAIKVWPR